MKIIESLFLLLGGVTVFLLGLKNVGENFSFILGKGMKRGLSSFTRSSFSSLVLGAFSSALFQSSVAVNVILISLVEAGVISFLSACAVILGTNIGTTVTAQLVSLSFSKGFSITALGSFVGFLGFLFSFSAKERTKALGNAALGFGLIFIGIDIMTRSVQNFYGYQWFKNFFLIKSPTVLLLNGFFLTAICQSSSVVTSMLVILASGGLIKLRYAVYLILGANIGSCISVLFISSKMSLASRRTAWFNLLFNAFGAFLFFFVNLFFGERFEDFLLSTSNGVGGAVANFHTGFNLIMSLITLPLLKPFSRLVEKLSAEEPIAKNFALEKSR